MSVNGKKKQYRNTTNTHTHKKKIRKLHIKYMYYYFLSTSDWYIAMLKIHIIVDINGKTFQCHIS